MILSQAKTFEIENNTAQLQNIKPTLLTIGLEVWRKWRPSKIGKVENVRISPNGKSAIWKLRL